MAKKDTTDRGYVEKANVGKAFRMIGEAGFERSSGIVTEAPLRQLQGMQGIKIFSEMYHLDPIIGGIMCAIEQTFRQAEWSAVAHSDSQEDMRAKEFLEENMADMEHSWHDFTSDVLTFLPYGFSPFEIMYKFRKGKHNNPSLNSKYNDGKVGWREFDLRKQVTLDHWEIDKKGRTSGFWQLTEHLEKPELIPFYLPDGTRKLIHFKTKPAGGNPEGWSVLMNAYRPWLIKKRLEEIEGIGIERDLAGVPVLAPPPEFDWDEPDNSAFINWAKQVITHMRRDEYMGLILPSTDWDFKLASSIGTRQHNTSEIITRYDKRIAMTSISQFILMGMDRVGSFALVKSLWDMWLTALQGWMVTISETLNKQAVPSLFAFNPEFASYDKLPRIKPDRLNVPDLVDLSNYLNAVSGNSLTSFNDEELRAELLRFGRLPQKAAEIDPHEESMENQEEQMKLTEKYQPSLPFGQQGGGAKGKDGKPKPKGAPNVRSREEDQVRPGGKTQTRSKTQSRKS